MNAEPAPSAGSSGSGKSGQLEWQKRLLPLMTRVVVFSTVFFVLGTLLQLAYLEWRIGNLPTTNLTGCFAPVSPSADDSSDSKLQAAHLEAMVWLEASAMARRYHQSSVAQMSAVWRDYLGFLTGMLLAMVGAVFILGKLQESRSEVDAKFSGTEVNLKTASPGIVLAGLGVTLMLAIVVTRPHVETQDAAIYTAGWVSTPSPALPLLPPETGNEASTEGPRTNKSTDSTGDRVSTRARRR